LVTPPARAFPGHVRPVLLGGVQGFLTVRPSRWKKDQTA
jgi:hypothetical protein